MEAQELTKQERKIAHLIAQGNLTKEIADKLYISVHTVHTHVKSIRRKLHAHSIADITREYMLSLPRVTDVLKAALFLTIQFHIIFAADGTDLRRPRRMRSVTRITRVIKTKQ